MDLTQFSPSSALLTVVLLALAPFVAVMVTSFTKLVVVLSLLRNALGLQQVPPNVVLNGLALVLSIYVMYPVGVEMGSKLQGINDVGGGGVPAGAAVHLRGGPGAGAQRDVPRHRAARPGDAAVGGAGGAEH